MAPLLLFCRKLLSYAQRILRTRFTVSLHRVKVWNKICRVTMNHDRKYSTAVDLQAKGFVGENMENNETRVALLSIIVENPDSVSKINEILHSASDFIIGRMGVPYRQKNISIISVAIDAPLNVINTVSGKLGRLEGVSAKTVYSKK